VYTLNLKIKKAATPEKTTGYGFNPLEKIWFYSKLTLVPPYLTFPQAPLRSRTVGFPESGSDRGMYSYGLSTGGGA